MHDNIDCKIWEFRSKRNCSRDLQIARCIGESSRPYCVQYCFLVDWIDSHVLNWWNRSSVSDCETLQVEIVITRMSLTLESNNYQPIVKTQLAKVRKTSAKKFVR